MFKKNAALLVSIGDLPQEWDIFACFKLYTSFERTSFVSASVGRSAGSEVVSASVQEADNVFLGFSYVPSPEAAFS